MKKIILGLLVISSSNAFALDDKICGKVQNVSFYTAFYESFGAGKISYPAMKVKFVDEEIFYVHGYPDGTIRSYARYNAKNHTVDFSVDFDSTERQERAKKILEESDDQISCITFFNNIKIGKGSNLDEAARTDVKL